MNSKKRIIFTLLYNSGKFVLSRNFRLQSIGNIDWLKENYNFDNVSYHIDELLILDVSRDIRDKEKFSKVISQLSENIFVPLTVGGGIGSIEDAKLFFRSGADKVALNTSLFKNKNLSSQIAKIYGKQCLIGSLDLLKKDNKYYVYINNGQNLICSLQDLLDRKDLLKNIGELYVNSINQDGTGNGLDFNLAKLIKDHTDIPFIISGGIGKITDFPESLKYNFIRAVSTAHLLNFIGDSLCKSRILCRERGIELASWPDIDELF